MSETLLEAEEDAGADSCSNSRTKEKHSQLALDGGNPLTVQHESIRACWRREEGEKGGRRGEGQIESQGRAVITRRSKEDFESLLRSDAV